MPLGEPFLSNRDAIERYLPEDATMTSFEFDTCSESNCFSFSPESKENITYLLPVHNVLLLLIYYAGYHTVQLNLN